MRIPDSEGAARLLAESETGDVGRQNILLRSPTSMVMQDRERCEQKSTPNGAHPAVGVGGVVGAELGFGIKPVQNCLPVCSSQIRPRFEQKLFPLPSQLPACCCVGFSAGRNVGVTNGAVGVVREGVGGAC